MRTQKRFILWLSLITVLLVALNTGCARTNPVASTTTDMPKTPEAAGIETLDSTSCEGCHTDPQAIAAFEKPEAGNTEEESGGG